MAGIFGYSREAVRVKVKKCEANVPPEWRKFSVDPQITSLEVLYSILAKAFDLKADFAINYKTIDPHGREIYLAVLSDWDLDAAFLRAHNLSIATSSEPCLNLKIDIKPFSETSDWESANNVVSPRDVSQFQQSLGVGQKYVQNMQNRLPGLIMNQMEKTLSMVTKALNLVDDQNILQPPRPPLSDNEFRSFLDSVGQIVHPLQLRNVIYAGGIDPSLRRVVWKHILNVYPNSMTGRERMDYMKRKSMEYHRLRDVWRTVVQKGNIFGEVAYVTSMVRKDVLRTDRLHPFYAGSDDNQNIASLFNILTTYALNHPTVSYCQGMSDIASPLLVTMGDEAQAYICFCAVMARLNSNFMLDGIAMTKKFAHLSEALQHYDPVFYEYLKCQQADDLLFCYRWLLLEMKREFAFDDSLRMLEVLWSALPAEPPTKELSLFEKEFLPPQCDEPPPKSPPIVMLAPRENVYTKLCELRRQSSAQSLLLASSLGKSTPTNSLDGTKRLNHSLDETMLRHQSSTDSFGKNSFLFNDSVTLCNHQKIALECDICDSAAENNDDDSVDNEHEKHKTIRDVSDLNGISLLRSKSVPLSCADIKSATTDDRELKRNTVYNIGVSHNNHNIEHKTLPQGNSIFSKHHHRKGHFNDLKERIVASKKGILSSLDKLDNQRRDLTDDTTRSTTKSQKVVKNFNEFLNFASINKSRIADKLSTEKSSKTVIRLAKPSFDESDSSSHTTATTTTPTTTDSGSHIGSSETMQSPTPLRLQLTALDLNRQSSVDGISPDDSQEYYPMTTSMTRELRLELENLDRHVFGNEFQHLHNNNNDQQNRYTMDIPEYEDDEIVPNSSENNATVQIHDKNYGNIEVYSSETNPFLSPSQTVKFRNRRLTDDSSVLKRISTSSTNADVFVWENPLHQISPSTTIINVDSIEVAEPTEIISTMMTPDEQTDLDYDGEIIETNMMGKKSVTPIRLLRKNGEPSTRKRMVSVATNKTQNRNSAIYNINSDSDTSDSWNESTPATTSTKTKLNTVAKIMTPTSSNNDNDLMLTPGGQQQQQQQMSTSIEEATEANIALTKLVGLLPPPSEFGDGNPFLMFMCLTLLLQHRNFVIKSNMDYNEMAMHFDKMVRKHNVTRVLNQARRMYSEYLKSQTAAGYKAASSTGTSKINGNEQKNEVRT